MNKVDKKDENYLRFNQIYINLFIILSLFLVKRCITNGKNSLQIIVNIYLNKMELNFISCRINKDKQRRKLFVMQPNIR